ncbi:MAG: hypothetical protein ACTSR9_19350, partial [Candidatus Thorarchaeota archaeon]
NRHFILCNNLSNSLIPNLVSYDGTEGPSLRNRDTKGGEEGLTHQPRAHKKEGARADRDRVDGDVEFYLFLLEAWGLII